VYRHGREHHYIERGPMRGLGILHFVKMRQDSAIKQLEAWRRQ